MSRNLGLSRGFGNRMDTHMSEPMWLGNAVPESLALPRWSVWSSTCLEQACMQSFVTFLGNFAMQRCQTALLSLSCQFSYTEGKCK